MSYGGISSAVIAIGWLGINLIFPIFSMFRKKLIFLYLALIQWGSHRLEVRFFFLFFLFFKLAFAQYVVKGKITDAATGEALPFVVVQIKGFPGVQTDFEGNYVLRVTDLSDSIKATYVGYVTRAKPLAKAVVQVVNFQLKENTQELGEVVVKRGENPAWAIMRKVMARKDSNDRRKLESYEYKSYTKMEVDLDNISKKLKNKKYLRKIMAALDSIKRVTDDEGKPVIPLYISETNSTIYYRANPNTIKESIEANRVSGVMDKSTGNMISEIAGSSLADFNFYKNWIRYLSRDFVSPLADSWKEYYEYDLEDSLIIQGDYCYKINIKPKREADLAFNGTIWITKKEYALKQISVSVSKSANINFIEGIKISQEFIKSEQGPWLTKKFKFLIDVAELSDSTAGMIIKYYVHNKDYVVNQPKPVTFYDVAVEVADNAGEYDRSYWEKQRPDSLSDNEKSVFLLVDSIKKMPAIRTYIDIVDVFVNGYKRIKWIDLGAYVDAYSWNDIEQHRFRVGFRTNMAFSKKMQAKGFVAYGTGDGRFKYRASFDYWFSKKRWFYIGSAHGYELEQLSLVSNPSYSTATLFSTFARFGNLEKTSPFYYSTSSVYGSIDYLKGFTQKVSLNYQLIESIKNGNSAYTFGYYDKIGDTTSTIKDFISTTELVFESRFSKKEIYVFRDHNRISLGGQTLPVLVLKYHLGIPRLLGSQFFYHKFVAVLSQRLTVGKFGQSIYNIQASYSPNVLPYPLLMAHLGNETVFFNTLSSSMMNFFEFVSSKALEVHYQHHFNGYFFNRVPLFHKLNWREVISSNVVIGSVDKRSLDLIPRQGGYKQFNALDPAVPYVDVGIGVENILKFIRVDFFQRLTYTDTDYALHKYFVKIGFQLNL